MTKPVDSVNSSTVCVVMGQEPADNQTVIAWLVLYSWTYLQGSIKCPHDIPSDRSSSLNSATNNSTPQHLAPRITRVPSIRRQGPCMLQYTGAPRCSKAATCSGKRTPVVPQACKKGVCGTLEAVRTREWTCGAFFVFFQNGTTYTYDSTECARSVSSVG